jgi:hypothetical protein
MATSVATKTTSKGGSACTDYRTSTVTRDIVRGWAFPPGGDTVENTFLHFRKRKDRGLPGAWLGSHA